MIQISHAATQEILRLKSKQPTRGYVLRIAAIPGGCMNWVYSLSFDDSPQPEDRVSDCGDLQVAIAAAEVPHLEGLTIDYSEDMVGGSFRFHNPNAAQTCDCGNSFLIAQSQ